MDQEINNAFNKTIGAVLTYLDEAQCGFATKKAVKSELWELCDNKIVPMFENKELGNGTKDITGNC